MVHVIGLHIDAILFWASLLSTCLVIILATIVHIIYSLTPARQRVRIAGMSGEVLRRDMDRMAEYLDGLSLAVPAVRQPFEHGLAAMQKNQWKSAIEHFREAMPQAKGGEIVALFNLTGVCNYTQGLLDRALENFEVSGRLAEQLRDEEGKPPALGNIGAILHDKGDFAKALRYNEEALQKARGLGNQWAEAVYLGNIGNIRHDMGELDRALDCHEKALELSRSLGDSVGMASDLAGIGSIYRDKGVLGEALQYDKEALALARKVGHRLSVVTDLGDIASIYRYKGELGRALKYDEEALAEARRIGYRLGAATDLGNIGLILTRQRKYGQAVPKLAEALTILLATGVADGPRQVLAGLARCEDKLGREQVGDLLREAGLPDAGIADLFERIGQARGEKPEPPSRRRA